MPTANSNGNGGLTKEQWGTRIGVILAVAGSAVGLGNFLRFPGNAAANGGGAFMLPYFISLLVLGIPLCWAEWTMGRYAGARGFNSAPGIYTLIWRNGLAKYVGGFALMVPLIIYMYYVLIEAWCLGYAVKYLSSALMLGDNPDAYKTFFVHYTGMGADGAAIDGRHNGLFLLILAGVFSFNFVLIYRGVNKGIETFCRVAMPLMVALAVIVLLRVLTLPPTAKGSIAEGLNYMWQPKSEALWRPETWLAASSQIFFSLSVGFGIIVNYASYLRENDDVALSGLTSSSMNEFFEVCLGGLITIPAAYLFLGPAIEDYTGSSFALGFRALPNVFANMQFGQFFGFLWFFMLFSAAVTSSVSMLQPVIAFLEEGLGMRRHASAAVLGLVSAFGVGFVMYFSKDLMALDTLDFWVGTVGIFLLATFQSLIYGWAFGVKKGHDELHKGSHIRIPFFVQLMLKFVVPVYLIVIFVGFCWDSLPSRFKPKASANMAGAAELDRGQLPDDVREALAQSKIAVPESFVVKKTLDGEGWQVISDQRPVLRIRRGTRSDAAPANLLRMIGLSRPPEDALAPALVIESYAQGRLETVARNRTALISVMFIGIVLAFLFVLVHIAGRRWAEDGRFASDGPTMKGDNI